MLLSEIVATSTRVSKIPGRLRKIEILADLLRRIEPHTIEIAVSFLSGVLPQGRIGVGPSLVNHALGEVAAENPFLHLQEVNEYLEAIAVAEGPGSVELRRGRLAELFSKATRAEREFLARLLLGDLRQGALEAILVEAVAKASRVSVTRVRRAVMLEGELAEVARVAFTQGVRGLDRFSLRLFRPVRPMLAQTADSVEEALSFFKGEAIFDFKMDGARIQVHRSQQQVRVFTRSLKEVTDGVPEIVEAVQTLPGKDLVLDGEALVLNKDGRPVPFQVTMRRFGRRKDVERLRKKLPLQSFFFDCMYLDGASLIDQPTQERHRLMDELLPAHLRIPRLKTADVQEAQNFLQAALKQGHEGLLAKAPGAPYKAGSRGKSWLKIKPAETLDLLVLAAEWGHGRRRGFLSNLHLGARDPEGGDPIMLGKTFKGMTDSMLQWQTEKLLEIEVGRKGSTVYVRPQLVVEIAFNEIQESPRYPGGMALRFARVKAYRSDKSPEEADTMEKIRSIFRKQRGQR